MEAWKLNYDPHLKLPSPSNSISILTEQIKTLNSQSNSKTKPNQIQHPHKTTKFPQTLTTNQAQSQITLLHQKKNDKKKTPIQYKNLNPKVPSLYQNSSTKLHQPERENEEKRAMMKLEEKEKLKRDRAGERSTTLLCNDYQRSFFRSEP